ncbi:RWD domain protein [Ancylostoma caninum]|uniref:RWD domain protein n=1 Tax=Ancylostoma caninum TaxID=29170 RepID=A0A368H835_ANCCA|nr:RWD domain protein [Ancylostoma caninum]
MTEVFPQCQEEELEAVISFFGEQYVSVDRSGELLAGRISIELEQSSTPVLFYVHDGRERKSFNTKQLPPIQLVFRLPKEYPTAEPNLTVECIWISKDWTEMIQESLSRVITENSGFPVLFIASQEVKDFVQSHQQESLEICLDDNPYSCAHDIHGNALLDLVRRKCREYDEKVFAERCHDCEIYADILVRFMKHIE